MEVASILAYYDTATISAVKSFIVQARSLGLHSQDFVFYVTYELAAQ